MNHHYRDIIERIPTPPLWWDEQAVPRYDEFTPQDTNNIYADEAVLLLIQCQACATPYKVAFSSDQYDRFRKASMRKWAASEGNATDEIFKQYAREGSLSWGVLTNEIHYGDPPNACPQHCAAGATMNSVPLEVLEFWVHMPRTFRWERIPALERKIDCDWWPPEKEEA